MSADKRWDTRKSQQRDGEGMARKTEEETTECGVTEQRAESLSGSELPVVPEISSKKGT